MSRRPAPNVPAIVEDRTIKRKGQTYVKRYKKGKLLGKGGFAHCFELTSFDSHRLYAGKVVAKSMLQKPSSKKKLLNEIKIHRSFNHRHVVKFERFFEDKDNVYIMLELCKHQTLMELSKRRKRLSEPEVQYYGLQLLSGIRYLHKQNVIHRDLKLGNLFLGDDLCVKIGDFGLCARLEHSEERKKTICGTPNYIAPEILNAGQDGHSFEVDVWSTGVILYTLLVGKPPFETSNIKSTYRKIKSNSYTFPPHVKISDAARELIQWVLSNNPKDRPDVEQLANHRFFKYPPPPTTLPLTALTVEPKFQAAPLYKQPQPEPASQPFAEISNTVHRQNQQPHQANNHRPSTASARVTGVTDALRDMRLRSDQNGRPESAGGVVRTRSQTRQNQQLHHHQPPPQPRNDGWTAAKDAPQTTTDTDHDTSGDEHEIIQSMHDEIEQSFANPSLVPSKPLATNAFFTPPSIWCCKWVDYSNKYGLGYLLSDRSTGVYFNDSTKIILSANGRNFEYIERRQAGSRRESRELFSLDKYPTALQKKVTLLKHFRNYLHEHQKKNGQDVDSPSDSPSSNLVYVKKWLRTKHAIMFRLSNRTVQVNFLDQTEIILSSEHRLVTYTNKQKERQTLPLSAVLSSAAPDLEKRMKYVKDILSHLISKRKD